MHGIVGNMDPSYARKLLDYNRHTSNPALHPDPFAYKPKSSHVRATMAAMNRDAITAGLWALAGFDPALVHFAELREHLNRLDEGAPSRVSLDRALSVYLEGQCHELVRAAEITREAANAEVDRRLGDVSSTVFNVLAVSDDPLCLEIMTYAMYLGTLTAHDIAPWRRFVAVMDECARLAMEHLARR